jgi:hypothetical protein
MAVDVTAIQGYIASNIDQTILKTYFKSPAMNIASNLVGVAGKNAIPQVNVQAVLADASACGTYGESTAAITKAEIDAKLIGSQLTFCAQTLMNTYLSSTLSKGAYMMESSTVEQWLESQLAGSFGEEIGKLFWRGDVTLPANNNLSKADGFIKQLGAAGAAVSTPVSWTTANAYSEAMRIAEAYTGKNKLYIFLGTQKFKALVASIGGQFMNNNTYAPVIVNGKFTEAKERTEIVLPLAFDTICVWEPSLDGTGATTAKDHAYAYAAENVFSCVSLKSDESTVHSFVDQVSELLYMRMKVVFGVGIIDKAQVVKYIQA